MTFPPESASLPDADHFTFRQLLLLVCRRRVEPSCDWKALYELAAAERVAAVVWQRSGEVIRSAAPPEVVASWRALAMRVALQVEVSLAALEQAVAALKESEVHPVVLKGAPLAQLLYGDCGVRPLADCDLYVPLEQRSVAAEALARAGWTSRSGEPPSEETFERWAGGQRNVIEVHSSAIDDALLSHIVVPIDVRDLQVGSSVLPAFIGDHLPGYLAAHLLKHETAPLLWIVDLYTLWTGLDEGARARARARARQVGLGRHLEAAITLASYVERGADGNSVAVSRLLELRRATGDWGRVRRLVALSASPLDAARVLAGRVWPEEWRDGWMRAPNYILHRGARWLARRLQVAGVRRARSTTRALTVDDSELASLLDDTLERGLAIWVRPRGSSMQPAIPPSAAARIVPIGSRGLRENDIVLARLPHGHFVLHRVQRLCADRVQLKGDAMRRRDDLVERGAVIGLCDQVEINGTIYRADERPRDAVALLQSAARTRLRRFVSFGA